MNPVKVVMSRRVEGADPIELELGPFNQGVVMKVQNSDAPLTIHDVATGEAIARFLGGHTGWFNEGDYTQALWDEAFVQPYEAPLTTSDDYGLSKLSPMKFKRTMEGVLTARELTINVPTYLYRRLEAMGERADMEFERVGMELLERDSQDPRKLSENSIQNVLLGCAERGVELDEHDCGLVGHADGSVLPRPKGQV